MVGSTLLLFDWLTPRQLPPWVLALLGLFWLLLVIGFLLWAQRRRRAIEAAERRPRTKRQIIVTLLVFLVILLIAIGIPLGFSLHESAVDRRLLASAHQHFSVELHGNVSEGEERSTLIELEGALKHLQKRVETPIPPYPVEVHIFAGAEELQQFTGEPSWVRGAIQCTPNGAKIYLVAERAKNAFTSVSPTSTPSHEMVHVVTCMIVGSDVIHTIPRWFHEGLANYESTKGMSKIVARALTRFYVWQNWGEVKRDDLFLSYVPGESIGEDKIFYATSFEFMRYIVKRFGGQAPWRIISEVSSGKTFDAAFIHVTSYNCKDLYLEWVRAF